MCSFFRTTCRMQPFCKGDISLNYHALLSWIPMTLRSSVLNLLNLSAEFDVIRSSINPFKVVHQLGYPRGRFLFYTFETALLVIPAWRFYILILSFRLVVFDIMDWIKECHYQVSLAKAELLNIPGRPSNEHSNTLNSTTIKQPSLGNITQITTTIPITVQFIFCNMKISPHLSECAVYSRLLLSHTWIIGMLCYLAFKLKPCRWSKMLQSISSSDSHILQYVTSLLSRCL